MARPHREEVQRRIAQDEGDPDDPVVLLDAHPPSSVRCYHAHPRCRTLPRNADYARPTREHAQELGKAPCKVCVLDGAENPGQRLTKKLQEMSPEDAGLTSLPDPNRGD